MMASSSFSWCPSCLSASYLPSVLAATDCFANSLRQTWNGKAFACEAVLESSEQFSGSLSSVNWPCFFFCGEILGSTRAANGLSSVPRFRR